MFHMEQFQRKAFYLKFMALLLQSFLSNFKALKSITLIKAWH